MSHMIPKLPGKIPEFRAELSPDYYWVYPPNKNMWHYCPKQLLSFKFNSCHLVLTLSSGQEHYLSSFSSVSSCILFSLPFHSSWFDWNSHAEKIFMHIHGSHCTIVLWNFLSNANWNLECTWATFTFLADTFSSYFININGNYFWSLKNKHSTQAAMLLEIICYSHYFS